MLKTIKKVLIRFVILFVNFILGGVAGFCILFSFAKLFFFICFVVPIILFALILYKDRNVGNLFSFLAGGLVGFALLWWTLIHWWAIP